MKSDSPLADKANVEYAVIKETERKKYTPAQVVAVVQAEGFAKFKMHQHTKLWQSLDAKNPAKGLGVNVAGKYWHWYESWVEIVRQHCKDNRNEYQ